MQSSSLDTSVRVDAGVLNKLVHLAGELLAAREQLRAVRAQPGLAAPDVAAAPEAPPRAPTSLVLFATPDEGRMAVPLASVERIEEFDSAAVIDEGSRRAVRHGGALLPLVRVSALLPERRARPRRSPLAGEAKPRMQVIVVSAQGRRAGLVIDRLLDVVDERIELEQPGSRAGAAASALVRDRVTELVDLDALLAAAEDAWREPGCTPGAGRREG